MRIAYIGDFINHGKLLAPTGTSIVLLLSEIPDVEVIDVYCPTLNAKTEPFREPENVAIIESYSYDDPVSIFKLLKVGRKYYDKVIFNIMPTAFGNSSLSNLTGLLIPLMLRILFRKVSNIIIDLGSLIFKTGLKVKSHMLKDNYVSNKQAKTEKV